MNNLVDEVLFGKEQEASEFLTAAYTLVREDQK